jgi:proteic killer suppression protein
MILNFSDNETEKIWNNNFSKKFPPEIQKIAKRKLLQIHAAINLNDLKIPPGNRLHNLGGERKGQWSLSINDQWRICFKWQNNNAYDVEIIDYH